MKMHRAVLAAAAWLGGVALAPGAALAQGESSGSHTITGNIDAKIQLTSACQINDQMHNSGDNAGTLDTLNFASMTTFGVGSTASLAKGIIIQCSSGTTPTLTVISGNNDGKAGGYTHAMANGSSYLGYEIYGDSGYSSTIKNGGDIPLTAATDGKQIVNIYGKTSAGNASLPAGTYTDTLNVTLAF